MKEFRFLTKNIDVEAINCFADLESFLQSCNNLDYVVIDLTDVIFFNASLTSIFLSIINYYQQKKAIKVNVKCNDRLQNVLETNGLFSRADYLVKSVVNDFSTDKHDTYIPLNRFKNGETNYFLDYIERNLKYRHFTDDCLEKITYNLMEMFFNFRDHSGSEYFYISGQFFPNKDKINICLTDKGTGLAKYIMSKEQTVKSQEEAVKWAFKYGNTTRTKEYGGIGLKQLKDFVEKEKGLLIIYCNNIYFNVLKSEVKEFKKEFIGTSIVVNLPNNC